MLGIEDPWIAAGYILCLLSTLLCVIYGAIMWNKGDDENTASTESSDTEDDTDTSQKK